jgi:putative endonuclease
MRAKSDDDARNAFGKASEAAACAYLESLGYRVEGRNVRTSHGEIDIVALDGDALVFVEVKARRSAHYGTPQDAVTPAKRARLCEAALAYLQSRNALDAPCRFDVIALEASAGRSRITHLRDAFRCE